MDRDGTLVVDPPNGRIESIEQLQLFPDTIDALRLLAQNDFNIVIVSNQAGIAEGRITVPQYEAINQKLFEMLAPSGIQILKAYTCPHGEDSACECRKPETKLGTRAAADFNIDLTQTYVVGDAQADLDFAHNLGAGSILVRTGNTPVEGEGATLVASNLYEAAQYLADHR